MKTHPPVPAPAETAGAWDTSSHEGFFDYYSRQSESPETAERFRTTTETLLRLFGQSGRQGPFDILDIGCGAGAQGKFWLERGHRYRGIDINRPLIELARERARQHHLDATFDVASATDLPLPTASVDACVLPFLLEHVEAWQACVDEAARVLRPAGLLHISTTSKLCPVQDEFDLPGYAWYPGRLKKYFERRSVGDWPELTNHAKYPAVNWFSVYQLGGYLQAKGFDVFDRFDLIQLEGKGLAARWLVVALRRLAPLRFIGHALTPYTLVVGRKPG